MKEGKKKTTARRNSSSSASKRVVPKNQTPKMPADRSEPPKVKKIEVDDINKDFDDVETEDRRLIVFIAIAILVIVGTVIGLLVGCEKKEENTPEPEKPGGADVVVPEKPDEKGNKEDEDEGVVTKEIVRKVRATYSSSKSNKSSKSGNDKKEKGEEEEKVTYTVTFYLGEESKTEDVESGKTPTEYVPDGYSSCKYYTDSDLTEETEYDIKNAITENVNIYMSCEAITYTVTYGDVPTSNPSTYSVLDGNVELSDPQTEMFFNGWFTNPEFSGDAVTSLNKDIIEYADDNNVINLYAYLTEEEIQKPSDTETEDPTTGDSDDQGVDQGSVGNSGRQSMMEGLETEFMEGEEGSEVMTGEEDSEVKIDEENLEVKTDEEDLEVITGEEDPEVTTGEEDPEVTTGEEDPEVITGEEDSEVKTEEKDPEVKIEEPEVNQNNENVVQQENTNQTVQTVESKEEEEEKDNIDSTPKDDDSAKQPIETPKEEEKKVVDEPQKEDEQKKVEKNDVRAKTEKTEKVETPSEPVKVQEEVKDEVPTLEPVEVPTE